MQIDYSLFMPPQPLPPAGPIRCGPGQVVFNGPAPFQNQFVQIPPNPQQIAISPPQFAWYSSICGYGTFIDLAANISPAPAIRSKIREIAATRTKVLRTAFLLPAGIAPMTTGVAWPFIEQTEKGYINFLAGNALCQIVAAKHIGPFVHLWHKRVYANPLVAFPLGVLRNNNRDPDFVCLGPGFGQWHVFEAKGRTSVPSAGGGFAPNWVKLEEGLMQAHAIAAINGVVPVSYNATVTCVANGAPVHVHHLDPPGSDGNFPKEAELRFHQASADILQWDALLHLHDSGVEAQPVTNTPPFHEGTLKYLSDLGLSFAPPKVVTAGANSIRSYAGFLRRIRRFMQGDLSQKSDSVRREIEGAIEEACVRTPDLAVRFKDLKSSVREFEMADFTIEDACRKIFADAGLDQFVADTNVAIEEAVTKAALVGGLEANREAVTPEGIFVSLDNSWFPEA